MFYVDLEADIESASCKPVLDQLEKNTDYLRVLGSY
jgi:prephenate dehydratase